MMISRACGCSFKRLVPPKIISNHPASLIYYFSHQYLVPSIIATGSTRHGGHFNLTQASTIHTQQSLKEQKHDSSKNKLDIGRENVYEHLSPGQKVMQAGKDFTYIAIIVVGFTVIGIIFYAIGSELFSTTGPTKIYNDAFKKCQKTTSVCDALGAPLSSHSDGRDRRIGSHVRHAEYQTPDGEMHTQIQFKIKGQFKEATVHAETYKDTKGQSGYEYLVVDVHGHPPRKIVLEKRPPKSKPDDETVTFY